jgi:hypothetical protein
MIVTYLKELGMVRKGIPTRTLEQPPKPEIECNAETKEKTRTQDNLSHQVLLCLLKHNYYGILSHCYLLDSQFLLSSEVNSKERKSKGPNLATVGKVQA